MSETVKIKIDHITGDGALGTYINQHLKHGHTILLIPGHEYIEYVEKPTTIADVKHLDLGAKKM